VAAAGARRVLITGAAGLIGSVLREGLCGDYELVGLDVKRGDGVDIRANLARGSRRAARAFHDKDAVVDLAADARVSTPWGRVLRNNLAATVNSFEAARVARVRRVIFASSNHVMGMYELDEPYKHIVSGDYDGLEPGDFRLLTADDPIKPDGPYGVGKAFGEAVGRYYAETHGLSVICLRIGSCNRTDRPDESREYATWLSHADLVRLVDCCLRAPEHVQYAVYYGVSANTWRFWDLSAAREEIGYEPRDDAERWRSTPAEP
jgi:nucleoside-diphosphate-sugar epimerase